MLRIFSRKLYCLPFCCVLSACIPAPLGRYYKPHYPDSSPRYVGDLCQGQSGAPVGFNVDLAEGVKLSVGTHVAPGQSAGRQLSISLEVPQGHEVQFLAPQLRVSQAADQAGLTYSPELQVSALVSLPSDSVVDYQRLSAGGARDFSASVWLNFSWPDAFQPSDFVMALPRLQVAGAAVPEVSRLAARAKLRPVGKNGTASSLQYVTEASERLKEEKYARCQREGRGSACENILLYDDAVFQLEQGGVRYSGRWYVYDVNRPTPFNAEIKMDIQLGSGWRFVSPSVRFLDAAQTLLREHRFTEFPLSLHYRGDFDLPVRGVNNTQIRPNTTLSFSVDLGAAEPDRFFVFLPALRIDGKTYPIAPIEWELRRLDVGLLPFNC